MSLALVLAMALTLLPTAAFAACEANAHDSVADADALAAGYTEVTQKTAEASWDCTTGFVKTMPTLQEGQKLYKCKANEGCGKYFLITTTTTTDSSTQETSTTYSITSNCGNTVIQPGSNHSQAPANNDTSGKWTKDETSGKYGYVCETCKRRVEHTCSGTDTCSTCGATLSNTGAKSISGVGAAYDADAKTLTVTWTATNGAEGDTYKIAITASGSGFEDVASVDFTSTSMSKVLTATTPNPGSYTVTVSINGTTAQGTSGTDTFTIEDEQGGEEENTPSVDSVAGVWAADGKSLAVSWKGYFTEGHTFTVTLTKDGQAVSIPQVGGMNPGENLAASPITLKWDSAQAAGTYTIKVEAVKDGAAKASATGTAVLAASASTDVTPPPTNSQGIPVASEIKNEKQADAAVEILKNSNSDELQERLSTSTAAVESLESLDRTVSRIKNIDVRVEKEDGLPSVLTNASVSVVGAALNANASVVRFSLAPSSRNLGLSSGYQFSLTLTGVSNAAKLAVPVIVKLPVPAGMNASRLVVLHYHGGSSYPTVINPSVSGKTLSFVVSGFSDFVVTYSSEIPSDAYTGGAYTTVQGGKNKNDGSLDDATLASIAAMLSGDGVFVDVPGSHWAAKEIRWARDGGLMSGYENGAFGPTASTTRQQLWMVLARLSGTRPGSMAEARQWAINTGVSDGSNPTGALSRQQLVTMLYRFAKTQGKDVSASAKLTGFADSGKVASYAKEALSWASAKGIMSGSNGKLNPEGTATRAHFAVFLYRYSNG